MKVVAVLFRYTKEGGAQFGRVFVRDGEIKSLLKEVGENEHLRSASVLKKDPDEPEFYTTVGGKLLDGAAEIEEAISRGEVIILTYASKSCYVSPIQEG